MYLPAVFNSSKNHRRVLFNTSFNTVNLIFNMYLSLHQNKSEYNVLTINSNIKAVVLHLNYHLKKTHNSCFIVKTGQRGLSGSWSAFSSFSCLSTANSSWGTLLLLSLACQFTSILNMSLFPLMLSSRKTS